MDKYKKIHFSRRMLSNEHIGKKYLDRLKEHNAVNIENNYRIIKLNSKYIKLIPVDKKCVHGHIKLQREKGRD